MSLISTPYFNLACSGPAKTLLQDHCSTESHGGWNRDEVIALAMEKGWTETGRDKHLCPEHSAAAEPAAPAESNTAARKSRSRGGKEAPAPQEQEPQAWEQEQAS